MSPRRKGVAAKPHVRRTRAEREAEVREAIAAGATTYLAIAARLGCSTRLVVIYVRNMADVVITTARPNALQRAQHALSLRPATEATT